MAAQIDFCPHGREVASHGTANRPHRSNFRRTDGKMAAQIELLSHGEGNCPHRWIWRVREVIFASTKQFESCMIVPFSIHD